jgi:diguanylate cyclase (GGDEF)-like protein
MYPGMGASNKRAMALSIAAMYGAAAVVAVIETLLPGGPEFSVVPGLIALAIVVGMFLGGHRLPKAVLAMLAPIGVVLIGISLATTEGPGDGAVLYVWPTLWAALFLGRVGAIMIIAWVGVVHAVVLATLAGGDANLDRWLDVMVTMVVVAGVVRALASRNELLVEKLATEARIDTLTGLLNRRGFEERVGIELQRAHRQHASIAIVSFDIDHFKEVNDEHGHEAGDHVLVHLAAVFEAETRHVDMVARRGGEEFVALLTFARISDGRIYAERVRTAFAAGADRVPRATLSAGVAAAIAPADIEPLLQAADSAMYEAKAAGRNRTVVHGVERSAARNGELVTVAQPS